MKRDRLLQTLGVLLAGMFEAEKCALDVEPSHPRVRDGSGVYPRPLPDPPLAHLSEPPSPF